jgi:Protein of unknown function (DUF4256)
MTSAITISPEVKNAATQIILSEGDIKVIEVLNIKRDETLALVQKLLAAADIKDPLALPANYIESEAFSKTVEKNISPEQKEKLLNTLKTRFEKNMNRHENINWIDVEIRLNEANQEKLWSLNEMEKTGGEPDVICRIEDTGEYEFWDFSAESPTKRRNLCYDRIGEKINRKKEIKQMEDEACYYENSKRMVSADLRTPSKKEIAILKKNAETRRFKEAKKRQDREKGNAIDIATFMGLGGILNEYQYKILRHFGTFDKNSESWIVPVQDMEKGFGRFCKNTTTECRNAMEWESPHTETYNATRGFRGWLVI